MGAVVAVWSEGHVLIIQNSYREQWSLPGGGIQAGEDPVAAIIREAKEEVGITLSPYTLRYLGESDWAFEHVLHRDHVFQSMLPRRPAVDIDNREIIRAEWHTRTSALEMDLTPQLRQYLKDVQQPMKAC